MLVLLLKDFKTEISDILILEIMNPNFFNLLLNKRHLNLKYQLYNFD